MTTSENYLISYFFVINNQLFQGELFYFNMIASMRKYRMPIPVDLSLEYVEKRIFDEVKKTNQNNSQVEFIILRSKDKVSYEIKINSFVGFYNTVQGTEIEVYKDEVITPGILSTINCFKPELVIAKCYAEENDLYDVIILNNNKRIARTILGDLFLLQKDKLLCVPKEEGATNQTLSLLVKQHFINQNIKIEEKPLSPFETQKADEVFIVSEKEGIISIGKIRNKVFSNTKTQQFIQFFENLSLSK
ncbi:MAG: aminotransferase class IV [Flavobacteriales bacterium]|nr:aminotransferase class IV [Flavobacteriales bacterium]